MSVEKRLEELGLDLPEPAKPAYKYVPVVSWGGVAYVSGQLPRVGDDLLFKGKVPVEVSMEQAQECARACILQALASLRQHLGNLDLVERVVKVTGFVNSAPGFDQQPRVIDAASELLVEVFGEKGQHARSAIGVSELPRGSPVEIEMVVAIKSPGGKG